MTLSQAPEGPTEVLKNGNESNREKCILCYQPHSTPGNPGISRHVKDSANVFEIGLDAKLSEKMFQYGEFWCCSRCEPLYQAMETECSIFMRVRRRFNEIRTKVAKIIVDSVKTSNYLDSNLADGNAFDSTRGQIFTIWHKGLKHLEKQEKRRNAAQRQDQTPQSTSTVNSTDENELNQSTNTSNTTATSAVSKQPEPEPVRVVQQQQLETSAAVPTQGSEKQRKAEIPTSASEQQSEQTTTTRTTNSTPTIPEEPMSVVQEEAPKPKAPATPAPSTSSPQRIVSKLRNSGPGPLRSTVSQPNLKVTRHASPVRNRTTISHVDADPLEDNDEDEDENSFGSPIIIAVESLSTKARTRNLSGGNQTTTTGQCSPDIDDACQSSASLQTAAEDDEAQPQPMRKSYSLGDLNKNHNGGAPDYTSNKIDATAATFAARAFVPTLAPAPAAPTQNTNNLVRTKTGSNVRIVYTPGKVGSVRIKRHHETGAITDLFTSDKAYLEATIDDSEKGVLTITPINGGPSKTFRYTPKTKKKVEASGVRRTVSASELDGAGEKPKSPSPPQLERMDMNLANGAASSERKSKSVPPVPTSGALDTVSSSSSSSADSGAPDSTTSEVTKSPPTLTTQSNVRQDAGEPSVQIRTSGRSGRAIKRPYGDSQWVSEVEIDKLIGEDAEVAKHSRAKTSRKGDETKEKGSGSGRARRASIRQTGQAAPAPEAPAPVPVVPAAVAEEKETSQVQVGESEPAQVAQGSEPGTGLENPQEPVQEA